MESMRWVNNGSTHTLHITFGVLKSFCSLNKMVVKIFGKRGKGIAHSILKFSFFNHSTLAEAHN